MNFLKPSLVWLASAIVLSACGGTTTEFDDGLLGGGLTEEPTPTPISTPTATQIPSQQPATPVPTLPTASVTPQPEPSAVITPTPASPNPNPTIVPTATNVPTREPTMPPLPTPEPAVTPAPVVSVTPTVAPTSVVPSQEPSPTSTGIPTAEPTLIPTATVEPTSIPTPSPTVTPTQNPSSTPSPLPTMAVTPTPELTAGQILYAEQCQHCHGDENGEMVVSGDALTFTRCETCSSMDLLVAKIRDTMPFNDVEACDSYCAENIATYIFENFEGFGGQIPAQTHAFTLEAEHASLEGVVDTSKPNHIRQYTEGNVTFVGNIGGENKLSFYQTNFSIPGKYLMTIRYASAENRDLTVTVGKNVYQFKDLNTGDYRKTFLTVDKEIDVADVISDIHVGQPDGNAANVDKITFSLIEEVIPGPLSCNGKVLGSTPLQRLSRQEYINSVLDITGIDLTKSDISLPADEKISRLFDGNIKVPLTEAQFEQYMQAAEFIGDSLAETENPLERCDRYYINAGGDTVYNDSALWYNADSFATGGSVYQSSANIGGTTPSAFSVYGTIRKGNFSYNIPWDNGDYTVMLHFSEVEGLNTGERLFNVNSQGQRVLENLDVADEVGQNRALNKSFDVTISDGYLKLEFTNSFDASVDQCDFTSQCQSMFPSADDCANSSAANSVCMCGGSPCAGTSAEPMLSGIRVIPKLNSNTCKTQKISELGERIFRRPISDEELKRFRQLYLDTAGKKGSTEAYATLIAVFFQSPGFLYRQEGASDLVAYLNGEDVILSDYELASRLSYFLWQTTPDARLLEFAREGRLGESDVYAEQVDRLLSSDRSRAGLRQFYSQWLGIDGLESIEKDAEYFPNFSKSLATAMREDTLDFVEHIYEGDSALFSKLFSDTVSFTQNDDLLNILGAADNGGDAISLPSSERAGVLTQPSVMALLAHASHSSPVMRGVYIRNRFFCQDLPPPPPNVDDAEPEIDENATTRDRFKQHSENPACASCHALIDPIGFALENYDAVGNFRVKENNLEIDLSGKLIGTDIDGEFYGPLELASLLSSSEQVQSCMVENWMTYALKRGLQKEDDCAVNNLTESFVSSGGDLKQLMRTILLSETFKSTKMQSMENE